MQLFSSLRKTITTFSRPVTVLLQSQLLKYVLRMQLFLTVYHSFSTHIAFDAVLLNKASHRAFIDRIEGIISKSFSCLTTYTLCMKATICIRVLRKASA